MQVTLWYWTWERAHGVLWPSLLPLKILAVIHEPAVLSMMRVRAFGNFASAWKGWNGDTMTSVRILDHDSLVLIQEVAHNAFS